MMRPLHSETAVAIGLAMAIGLATVLCAARARAAEPSDWHLRAEAGTDFPVHVGGCVGAEFPYRLRLSTSVGYLPGPYVDAINGVVVGLGGYDQATADLVRSALQSSLVWRTHVGWRPFPKAGFYADVGYGYVSLGGGASAAELISVVTGVKMPAADPTAGKSFDIHSSLHMLDVELGWGFLIADRITVRPALGGAFTLGSSTKITPAYQPRMPQIVSAFARESEAYLDDIYTSYVFTPVVSLWAGYAFL
jgi:hypothetical protein